ncbi:MAG TPA: hypothetical protein EYO89_00885 [Candidatus Dadabacteria bacterium]|nr:hypothetical protein [Candidatus Dadabacteria bacterium]
MKYVLTLVFALGLAIPSFAVELSLGGFPSFMRFRWRSLHNATYHNILTPAELLNLAGGLDSDTTGEHIHFADMTLRLTPQLVLSDAVTIRSSIDVLSNAIAGGATGGLFGEDSDGSESGGVVMDDLRYTDRFGGAFLWGDDAIDEDYGSFTVKYMHADINLGDKGFVRIGRQPFDFAMGIYANGGHDPYSDKGFNVDRLLWLKAFGTPLGSLTLVLVSDYLGGGSDFEVGSHSSDSSFGLFDGNGQTVDYLASAVIIANGNLVYGAYLFPFIEQNNMSIAGTMYRYDMALALYSAYMQYSGDGWQFITEYTGAYGDLSPEASLDANQDQLVVKRTNYVAAARLTVDGTAPFSKLLIEAGTSPGDERNTTSNDYEGSIIRFSGAYNLDNLLFKHVIPTLYQRSGSVINASYLRGAIDYGLANGDNLNLQVIMAWNENDNPADQNIGANAGASDGTVGTIDDYIGTEYEATYSMDLVDGVELSLIGSYIDVGSGLEDALIAQAYNNTSGMRAKSLLETEGNIWAFQSRLMIFIDDFFKAPAATK